MLTIIYIYFKYTINVTYRPFKLRHVDDMDWVFLKCLGWVLSLQLQVKGWAGLNKWKGKCMKTETVDCIADSKRTTVARYGHAAGLFLTRRANVDMVDVRTSTFKCASRTRRAHVKRPYRRSHVEFYVRTLSEQVAQLSQRDRAAGWVSNGQKWKTGTERQYLRTI